MTNLEKGEYGWAAAHFGGMLGEWALLALTFGQGGLAKQGTQIGTQCVMQTARGGGGAIALGRFGQNKAALEALAQKYGARILDQPFPKGVPLADALRAEIDAAEKIIFRMKDVVPGTISYDIELKYILSNPKLIQKTIFIY
jgi:hypothetical protein